ncbi:hypothetical protein VF21_08610 [Pseudogymnoascus sp. 05NY08]|nr:hypothetical protein VF21_08610 [Pseudogymnoascus sp. 05NY08]
MASSSVSSILDGIAAAGKSFGENEAGSREALIEYSRSLVAALEIPGEFIQRSFWAEPAMSANIRIAVDVKLFQHLKEAGDAGLSASALSEKTGVDVSLLQRLTRHLVAIISFCYDTGRPSFNGFPEFFKKTYYQSPSLGSLEGPFQDAHKTQLPFFEWLVATPPHLQHFDSFMSAHRAGKANWYGPGFYPVSERMITSFDASSSDVLLVDIHDFFTPQPIKGARSYSLYSILHDWGDDEGVEILENLVLALKKGYSRVLLNEIVVSEEKPTIAATSMDMMMLAHFSVRERTEAEWRAILAKAGLNIVHIYTYPGVAESLIEAELA